MCYEFSGFFERVRAREAKKEPRPEQTPEARGAPNARDERAVEQDQDRKSRETTPA